MNLARTVGIVILNAYNDQMVSTRKLLWSAALLFSICIFLALSFKLPYSGRSLIGNFDPFPDTFYYVVPPLKFVTTGRFETSTRYGKVGQTVPPLYGVTLIPGYTINQDPRTYYFTNILLGIGSIVMLWLVVKKATQRSLLLTSFATLIYVTSYGIYWQPQLAMAENLLVFLLLLSLYFWQKPATWKTFVIIAILAWSLFTTKYVSLPLTAGWLLLLTARSCIEQTRAVWFKHCVVLIGISVVMLLLTTGVTPILGAVNQLTVQLPPSTVTSVNTPVPAIIWFSPQYLTKSFPAYGAMLLGFPTLHLWSDHRLVPPFFLLITLVWAVPAVIRRWRNQSLAWAILVLGALQFAFLSMIEMVQSRYAYVFIPLVVIGTTLALYQLRLSLTKKYSKQKTLVVMLVISSVLLLMHAGVSFAEMKTQLQVNRHQSEVAWWREGLVLTDQLFAKSPTDEQRIIVTALPPFLWEMYASKDLIVLPINEINYFTTENIWALRPPAGQSWLHYYQSLVNQPDIELYISTSGFTGGDYDHFQPFKESFNLEQVMSECNDTCKVYRLTKK